MGKPRMPAPFVPIGLEKILFIASRESEFFEQLLASRFNAVEQRGIRLTVAERLMLGAVSERQLVAMVRSLDPSKRIVKQRGMMRVVAAAAVTLAAGTGAGCGGTDRDAWDSVKLPPEACASDYDPTWGSRPHPSECEDKVEQSRREEVELTDAEAAACQEMLEYSRNPPEAAGDPSVPFPIPEAHRVTLDPEVMNRADDRASAFKAEQTDIDEANRAIMQFLATAQENSELSIGEKEATARILPVLGDYYVQYFGDQSWGAKMLGCNFFYVFPKTICPLVEDAPPENWRREHVVVLGGGSHYWHVFFNLETKTLSSFHVNSPR